MPSDRDQKLLTETNGLHDSLMEELEAVRARQRRLEELYERTAAGNGKPKEAPPSEEPPEQAAKPPFRQRLAAFPREHPLGLVILLVILAIVLVGGFFLWRYLNSYESTDDAYVQGHLNPVTPRINGTVTAVHVENNQNVAAGQLLVELDPSDYQVAVQQARGNLQQAQGQLAAQNPSVPITEATTQTTVTTAQEDVTAAEAAVAAAQRDAETAAAELREAEANNVAAQADEARYRALVSKDEVPREQYDQKLAAARAAAAQVAARQAALEAARKAVTGRQAALAQARSRLGQAQQTKPLELEAQRATVTQRRGAVETAGAQLQNAELQLSYTKTAAPVAGIVGQRTVEVGQHVQAGEQLLVITETNDLWVTANFKETQIRRMRPGQAVTIHVDALDQDFQGYVENLAGATGSQYSLLPPENATGNYVKVVQRLPVRVRFRNGQPGMDRLRPGMSVEPKVWME